MIALIGSTKQYPLIQKLAQSHSESVQIFDQIHKTEELTDKFKVSTLYSHLVIDLSVLENTEDELCAAFFTLNAMTHSILLLLVQGYERDAPVIQRLREIGLTHFVFSWDTDRAYQELEQGYQNEPPPGPVKQEGVFSPNNLLVPPQEQPLTVGVAGVCPRIGVTTQAIRMSLYLLSTGHTVNCMDYSGSGHMEMMRDIFNGTDDHREAGCMVYHGLPLYYNPPDPFPPGISVCDFGADVSRLAGCNKKVLIAGSAPWELVALSNHLASLPHDGDTWYLFTFAGEGERQDILEFMETRWANTLFADYAPDMFAPLSEAEKETYRQIFDTRRILK